MKLPVILIAFALIIVGFFVVSAYDKQEKINLVTTEHVYKIDVAGKVRYDGLRWQFLNQNYKLTEMTTDDIEGWAPWGESWFNTGKVTVKIVLKAGTGETWSDSVNIGDFNLLIPQEKSFALTVNYVPYDVSGYTLTLTAVETGKGEVIEKVWSGIYIPEGPE